MLGSVSHSRMTPDGTLAIGGVCQPGWGIVRSHVDTAEADLEVRRERIRLAGEGRVRTSDIQTQRPPVAAEFKHFQLAGIECLSNHFPMEAL